MKSLWSLLRCTSDVVYFTPSQTQGGNLRDLLFLKLIQWRKKACVVHIHGGYYRQLVDNDCPVWQQRMNYKAVSRWTGGIVLGHSLHHIFEGMLPDEKIFVCPNCVDDAFIASSINKKLRSIINGEILHVLYLSNFIVEKGYREVLELAKIVQEKGDNNKFVFHFAGKFFDLSEEQYFKEHSEGLQNVVYHGIVCGQAKVDLLNCCHIFALLSRYPNEGQPISILEAMGNGMSIITTNHAGIPEIASLENGYVCDKAHIDVKEIYEYLLYSHNDRKKLAEVCRWNYATTKERYTEQQYIDKMDKIFEKICKA